jgi:predicted DNA-binding protein
MEYSMHAQGVAARRMKKLNFYFPPGLVERLEKIASSQSTNLSQVVREAVEEFVMRVEREEIERELAKASKANQEFDRQFAADWARFESETR